MRSIRRATATTTRAGRIRIGTRTIRSNRFTTSQRRRPTDRPFLGAAVALRDARDVPTLSEAALAFAVSQIGVHEQGGNNAGPEVNQYLASVGLDPGYAWCSAFVYWCFKQAAAQLGLVNPCPKTAGAVKLWTLTEPICRVTAPLPGAIYVLHHEGGKGHAGIIERVSDGAILEAARCSAICRWTWPRKPHRRSFPDDDPPPRVARPLGPP